jgi:hypothetical protein
MLFIARRSERYIRSSRQLLDLRALAEPALDKATRLGTPLGDPVTAINDGNGVGFTVAASWAMRLFGPHLFSLPVFTLGVMAISAVPLSLSR